MDFLCGNIEIKVNIKPLSLSEKLFDFNDYGSRGFWLAGFLGQLLGEVVAFVDRRGPYGPDVGVAWHVSNDYGHAAASLDVFKGVGEGYF